MQAELKVASGKNQGSLISLPQGKFLIGREEDCHLRPNSDTVSRHHCVFTSDEYSVRLRDLGSTNGTFVNGERVRGAVMLHSGDKVSVGKLEFEVVVRDASGQETTSLNSPSLATVMEPPAPASADTPLPMVTPAIDSETRVPNSSETMPAIPVVAPQPIAAQATPGFDTQVYQQGMPNYGQPMGGYQQFMPSPYGYPTYPQQYYQPQMPSYPMYPQMGMQPMMMPGMQGMPGMMPGMPGMMPGMPGAPAAEPEPAPSEPDTGPSVRLPDPASTGAKPPEPKPEPPKGAVAPSTEKNVKSTVEDILKKMNARRPGT